MLAEASKPTAPLPLDYAKSSARCRIIRRIFRITLLLTIIIAAATSNRWAPPAWHRAQLLYWQRQCLNYAAPPDQIVFESDQGFSIILGPTASNPPKCLAKLQQFLPSSGASLSSNTTFALSTSGNTFTAASERVSFIHQRRSRNGNVRLVVIGDVFNLSDSYDTCVPTGVFGGSPPIESVSFLNWVRPRFLDAYDADGDGYPDRPFHVRVYAGQIDPIDQSHFTIAYEIDRNKDIIDGYLQDDGSVTLTCRAGPSTRPIDFSGPVQFGGFIQGGTTTPLPPAFNTPQTSPRLGWGDLIDESPRRR